MMYDVCMNHTLYKHFVIRSVLGTDQSTNKLFLGVVFVFHVEISSRKTPDSNVTSCVIHETADNTVQYKRQGQAKASIVAGKFLIMALHFLLLLPLMARY